MQSAESDRIEDPFWYKDAVIYQFHVKTFYDANGDGIGDFKGVREKLDYFQELGVTALWLLPFYPSPLKDDGYDISDFRSIHPSYGTLRDFKAFLREAHKRDLKIITELVINHTSDQHPWFQRSRRAKPGSMWRDFYVWSDTPEKYADARIIFQDFENSNWSWDPVAGAYYWHRFYSHQPDLNFENPEVHEAVFKALDFWLNMGVDGLRLDAVPYLYEKEGTNCENLPETHAFLKKLRARMDEKYTGRMFLAEANQWPEDAVEYFGEGDECHMSFHFPLMPRLYMALHMENRYPVTDILEQTPPIPESSQWTIFLRNHDELTLEMVTDEERDYMYRVYAREPRMRLNLGIRRRLAPLMGNHRRRMEVMNGLLLSLPGTPVIYYGDEIGMGDNIYLGDRNGVRTPMQWSPDRNAGFSSANPQKLYLPVIIDPEYHYEVVNVESQKNNRHSLFWWMRRLITIRSRIQAFSRGSLTFLYPENTKILTFLRRYEEACILVVINFSRYAQFVELDLSGYAGAVPVEIFGNMPFPEIEEAPYRLTMGPHSFFWFSLQPKEAVDAATDLPSRMNDLPLFRVRQNWRELFEGTLPPPMEKRLATYMSTQRWYGAKNRRIKTLSITETIHLNDGDVTGVLLLVDLQFTDGAGETYLLPFVHVAAETAEDLLGKHPEAFLARVERRGETEVTGVLVDGCHHREFCLTLLKQISRRSVSKGRKGKMTAVPTSMLKKRYRPKEMPLDVTLLKGEQSNSSVIFSDLFILKFFRRMQEGTNPDLEISRFLTRKGFAHLPGVAGALEYHTDDEEPSTFAVLQTYVPNQGDGWHTTLNQLYPYFEGLMEHSAELAPPLLPKVSLSKMAQKPVPDEAADRIGVFLESVKLLAERTAQMHNILASDLKNVKFSPESFTKLYRRSLYQSMRSLAGRILPELQKRVSRLPDTPSAAAKRVLARKEKIMETFGTLTKVEITAKRIRCHGDYHLGQVLYTGNDFVII
ncbi:MAG: maltose alpha-D-glucosyltransferase, partial [Deltaproteobacteria bacterium]|nr:maltose alpha-D-glucosyltransferase [Deltaproteobacteria bacterium]